MIRTFARRKYTSNAFNDLDCSTHVGAIWVRVQNRRVLTIGVLRTAVVGLLQTRRKDVEKYEIQSDYSRYWTQRS